MLDENYKTDTTFKESTGHFQNITQYKDKQFFVKCQSNRSLIRK